MRVAPSCSSLAAMLAAKAAHGDDKAPPARPFGLTKRVPWTTSRIAGSPEPPPPYRLERVFPRIKFQGPVCIAQEPDTNRLLVGENNGKIYSFSIDDPNRGQARALPRHQAVALRVLLPSQVQGERPGLRLQPDARGGNAWPPEEPGLAVRDRARVPAANPTRLRAGHHRMALGRAQRRRGDHRARRISLHRHGRRNGRLRREQLGPRARRSPVGHDADRCRSSRPGPELFDPQG